MRFAAEQEPQELGDTAASEAIEESGPIEESESIGVLVLIGASEHIVGFPCEGILESQTAIAATAIASIADSASRIRIADTGNSAAIRATSQIFRRKHRYSG